MISKSLDSAVKVLKPQIKASINNPSIENLVFKLHTKGTVLLLLTFFFLVCTKEYFGDHIKCYIDDGIPAAVVNNFCFFMSTFTIDTDDNRHLQPGHIPHRGLGPQLGTERTTKHKYYQWVPFVLFFQCICFCIPHLIWKKEEGGRMKALVTSLEYARLGRVNETEVKVKGKVFPSRNFLNKKVEVIRKDILFRLQVTRSWSICLITMEVLNLLNLIVQIWITDIFLNRKFLTLGSDWLRYDSSDETAVNPLEVIFPLMTKCNINKYGPSGSIIHYDVMCVMALNILYEKIYAVLWFWFLILLILSVLGLIWRVMSFILYSRMPRFTQILYRKVTPGRLQLDMLSYVIKRCHYADWLFLYYLAKNMPGFLFEELFIRLHDELKLQGDGLDTSDSGPSTDDPSSYLQTLPLKTKMCDDEE